MRTDNYAQPKETRLSVRSLDMRERTRALRDAGARGSGLLLRGLRGYQ
jgi:hypothetical protein